jgi:hypothetical protein
MDNRNTPRTQLLEYLDVLDRDGGEHIGYLGDISSGGLMFLSRRSWAVGDRLRLRITLEDEQAALLHDEGAESRFSGQNIDCEVEARWIKPNINPQFQCIGCVFTAVDPAQLPLIQEVGRHLGVDQRVTLSRVR